METAASALREHNTTVAEWNRMEWNVAEWNVSVGWTADLSRCSRHIKAANPLPETNLSQQHHCCCCCYCCCSLVDVLRDGVTNWLTLSVYLSVVTWSVLNVKSTLPASVTFVRCSLLSRSVMSLFFADSVSLSSNASLQCVGVVGYETEKLLHILGSAVANDYCIKIFALKRSLW